MEKSKGKRTAKKKIGVVNNEGFWWWLVHRGVAAPFISISLFALLIRVAVSMHPYSGEGHPPKYGDFEAQRHWMEITLNLPPSEWYRNSTSNDLSYWGLDYPPLTAYQSYIHGILLRYFNPDLVALLTSRGHESYLGKFLMRCTVLSSDVLMFFPAVFYFVVVFYSGQKSSHLNDIAWHIAMLLLNPCLILIDHGHFQYNCISLGLTLGAVASVLSQNDLLACVLYCLALNHKQMSAYFAPAFFSHLLGKCLRRQNPLLELSKLGFVVIGTFAVIWWPYLHSADSFLQVLSRLAPFERGIYEDYVANFWCATSVLIKWKRLFTTQSLRLISFAATISTCLPSMVVQIWFPCKQGFLYGLLNSSLAFYLFSFQVHEKSILLPLLPASLLAVEEFSLSKWLTQYALFSLFPLLCRDKLVLPYLALYALFVLLHCVPGGRQNAKADSMCTSYPYIKAFILFCSLVLHVIYLVSPRPEKYPFIFEAVIMSICFSQIMLLTVYTNTKQWKLLKHSTLLDKDKKVN